MGKYLIKRFLSLIPVVIVISIMLFTIVKMVPGDPIEMAYADILGSEEFQRNPVARQQFIDQKRHELGLDKGIVHQYLGWVGKTVRGDFGYSIWKSNSVKEVIQEPLKISIIINIVSITLAFAIAIFVGIRSAIKQYSLFDTSWQVTSLVFTSMPTFFIGMVLIFIFPLTLGWFQFGGLPVFRGNENSLQRFFMWANHLALPIITLTIGSLAGTIRYVRNAMIEVLKKDYIRTARSKGLSEKVVIYSHAFRNALIPVVTIVAGSLVGVFGGAAITESIFAINGIGGILIGALNARDFNIVLTMNLFYAVIGLLANVIMDISYALVDPRVKLS